MKMCGLGKITYLNGSTNKAIEWGSKLLDRLLRVLIIYNDNSIIYLFDHIVAHIWSLSKYNLPSKCFCAHHFFPVPISIPLGAGIHKLKFELMSCDQYS
jgi:hypothetical protein